MREMVECSEFAYDFDEGKNRNFNALDEHMYDSSAISDSIFLLKPNKTN